MKLNSHQIPSWITLIFTCCICHTSASTLYHTGASSNALYHTGASSNALYHTGASTNALYHTGASPNALYHSGASPSLYPSYYASAYPSYFAPSYPQARYLWPSYARVPVATVPAALPAVPAALPAVPAVPAVPTYKYVTVIPQNTPPHGYSVSYFRKFLTTIPAVPAIPAAVPAIPAAVPGAVIPRPTLYAGLYPHVHQRALLPHVHPVGAYLGAAGTLHPQVQPPYPYRAAGDC